MPALSAFRSADTLPSLAPVTPRGLLLRAAFHCLFTPM